MSMAFEDPCFVYVGASGAVFGFIGKPFTMLTVSCSPCINTANWDCHLLCHHSQAASNVC